ncbi:Na+/H+ antiporter subunit E [Sneathiella sp.]|uniref:Na+/H+ antiporter subunit E n=1 Tax=Sneathiella sp. TaxID=1964365 RepID=UPI002FE118C9
MIRTVSLFATLLAAWLLWSGHYTPLVTGFGVLSCLFAAWIAHRMRVIDSEAQPLHLGFRIIPYWCWLLVEIYKANIDVAKCVLFPKAYLRPSLFAATASQKSDLGKVIYANSITLTPGTVTVDLDGDQLLIHALTTGGAEGVLAGDMDRRITAMMEGSARS